MGKSNAPSIEQLASAVFDNGRRGGPKPGCDCMQCFGYCMIDADEAVRSGWRVQPAKGASSDDLGVE